MPIKIEIIADNEKELDRMLATLSRHLFAQGAVTTPGPKATGGLQTSQLAKIEPMDMGDEAAPTDDEDDGEAAEEERQKRGRGRPPGSKNKPKDDAPDAPDSKASLSKAIEILNKVFARGFKGADEVKALTKRYQVRKFADVPLDKAADLLADAERLDRETEAPAA